MQSKHTPLLSFLLVIGVHVGVIAAIVMSPSGPVNLSVSPPTIQGVLVMAEPEPAPVPIVEETPPPPPEKPPEPIPKPKPIPKAPPSERAVKAPKPEPIPAPAQQPVEKPVAAQPAPVIPPRAEAGQLSNPAPVYPSLSRRLREEGVVLLEILIKANGTVGEVRLKTSSGYKRLDAIAAKAVANWRYQPASQDGKNIDFWYEQPVEFKLH